MLPCMQNSPEAKGKDGLLDHGSSCKIGWFCGDLCVLQDHQTQDQWSWVLQDHRKSGSPGPPDSGPPESGPPGQLDWEPLDSGSPGPPESGPPGQLDWEPLDSGFPGPLDLGQTHRLERVLVQIQGLERAPRELEWTLLPSSFSTFAC